MKIIAVIGLLLLVVAVLAFILDDPKPGNPAVHTRINSLTSCAELQREFNTAILHHDQAPMRSTARENSMGYATAADNQMKKVGCYE